MGHFGTDGIRNKSEVFTEEYLRLISLGIAYLPDCKKVVIGRDPRMSGPFMENVIAKVLKDNGVHVLLAGMVPTPCLSYLTKRYNCDYGIMLSASHNPPEYNGVKLFARDGSKVSGEVEKKVEEHIDRGIMLLRLLHGKIEEVDGADAYIDYLLKRVNVSLDGMKIALDCANGATSIIAPKLFEKAGAEVHAFFTEHDGVNINCDCGATVSGTIKRIMAEGNYDLGFTYDGDGDRLMCVCKGKLLNGDHLMYVHCKDMMTRGELVENTMVGTVMSNLGTENACKAAGINLVRTAVGDKHVHREMKKCGYNVGGEESGHVIFSDYMPTGDGILASLLTAKLCKSVDISVSDDIEECPSVSDCVICDKDAMGRFNESKEIKEYLNTIGKEFRTVIRPSGTEPKIRILVESASLDKAQAKAAEIKKFIEETVL